DEARDHAAAVDVADQHHRHVGSTGKSHVGDIVEAQVYLRRAACTFDENNVGFALQACEAFQDDGHQVRFHRLVARCTSNGVNTTLYDDLGADLALRFEQYRVHVHAWRDTRRTRLQCLGTANLAAVGGDRGIVRHILRLERTDGEPAIGEGAREPGNDGRLAAV